MILQYLASHMELVFFVLDASALLAGSLASQGPSLWVTQWRVWGKPDVIASYLTPHYPVSLFQRQSMRPSISLP